MRRVSIGVAVYLALLACADSAQKPLPPDGGVNIINPSPEPEPEQAPEPEPDRPEPEPDAPPLCDDLEPNDHPDEGLLLEGDAAALDSRICEEDEDWALVELEEGDRVEIALDFVHEAGDLDMVLYDPGLEVLATSESSRDDEQIEAVAARQGLHAILIYGYEGVGNTYSLRVERGRAEPACEDDALEQNDTLAAAHQILPPESLDAVICSSDDDLYVLDLVQGSTLQAVLEFSHATGDLDMSLTGPGGDRVAEGASVDDNEQIIYPVAAAGPHLLRVYGYGGAGARYRLTASVSGGPSPGGQMLTGAVSFDDPFLNQRVYNYARRPLGGAIVEVVDEATGEVLGQGSTSGSGLYRVRYEGQGRARVYARVLARRRGTEATLDVVTRDRRVYAVRTARSIDPSAGQSQQADMLLTVDGGAMAPFNTLDALNRGLEWWASRFEVRNTPALHTIWESGQQVGCGTCYRDEDAPSTVYLLGLDTDNDALDDAVILHELGHFLMNKFSSDDSPGGAHDGRPVDPRLAYAEGWATAFSSMVRKDPLYYDTRGESLIVYDLERPDDEFGSFTGRVASDPISEYFVASIMWDIFDAEVEPHDGIHADAAAVFPVIDYLEGGEVSSRGARGIDMVDYLDGAHCLDVAGREALDALLEGVDFPYGAPPGGCKPGAPMRLEVDGAGALRVVVLRPVDGVEVSWCRRGGCEALGGAGPLGDGEDVRVKVPVDLGGGHVEARIWRGAAAWAAIWGAPASAARKGWSPGPAAGDGAGVVERRAEGR